MRPIMQFVEKRIVRYIPPRVTSRIHIYYCGLGPNSWSPAPNKTKALNIEGQIIPRPSECQALGEPIFNTDIAQGCRVFVGRVPHKAGDLEFPRGTLLYIKPQLFVMDRHQTMKFDPQSFPCHTDKTRHWSWLVSTTAWGDPQSRGRKIHVSTSMVAACADFVSHFPILM